MNEFIEKQDYFGIADGDNLVCSTADEGKSNELAEATGQDGSYVAYNVYGEKLAPSNEYVMKAVTITKADGAIKLGQIEKPFNDDTSICLNNFAINTAAGSAPTFSASGEQVEDNSTGVCQYSIPAFEVTKKHHAQILFGAFSYNKTVSGGTTSTGVHLKSAAYTASGSITKGEKEGVCLTHDIVEGKIECAVEFVQVGNVKPVITPGTGWDVTSKLTCSNPDADWPSWSGTLTKYLAKDVD